MRVVMRALLISIAFLTLSNSASAKVVTEVFCFSTKAPKLIKFEMRTYYDTDTKWMGGAIKYEKSRNYISILQTGDNSDSAGQNNAASTTRTWAEVVGKKVTGEYEMISQGASVQSMKYTNIETKREFSFIFDATVESSLQSGCEW